MEAVDLLCSRNARPQKALVGRAQWEINQPPSLKRERASLEGRGETAGMVSVLAEPPHEAVVARCAQWRPHQPTR